MDMLIKGMEMPKEHPLCIFICPDGRIVSEQHKPMSPVFDFCNAKAVALPPHGELISRGGALFQLQAEALGISPNDKDFEGIKKGLLIARKIIIEAPVIVEASK